MTMPSTRPDRKKQKGTSQRHQISRPGIINPPPLPSNLNASNPLFSSRKALSFVGLGPGMIKPRKKESHRPHRPVCRLQGPGSLAFTARRRKHATMESGGWLPPSCGRSASGSCIVFVVATDSRQGSGAGDGPCTRVESGHLAHTLITEPRL